MANIQMNRGTKAEIDNTPITDGLISFDTDNNYIYLDNNDSRESYGGVKVIPNPEEEPTEVLRNIQVGEDVYKISGGHEIQDDAGDTLTQRDVMQFEGVYAYDDDTEGDEKTKISVVREFQSVAEIEALTGEAKKGFEVIEDNEEYIPYTGSDILFDNTDTSFEGENVQEVLEEVDERYKGVTLLSIPANTYNTWALALQALYVEYNKLTTEQKKRCSIIRGDDVVFKCMAISGAFTSVYAGSATRTIIQSLFLQSGIFLNHNLEGATISSVSWSDGTQTQKIELRLN